MIYFENKKGFALLYAIVMVSVISTIAFGLANISYKQKILSSLASDSQVAFYAADAGMECALFNSGLDPLATTGIMRGTNFPCFDISPDNFGGPITMTKDPTLPVWRFNLAPRKDTCFSIENAPPGVPPANPRPSFVIKGYNTCQPNLNRYVERTLRAYF